MQSVTEGRSSGRVLEALCALLITAGVLVRLHALEFPAAFIFDEHHFVENARNYLAGRADWNDHPPLGKLLIALAMKLLGDTSTSWRIPAVLCGLATIALVGLATARLARDARAGWLASAFVAADGFFISYSRVGLLDGQLVLCCAVALLLCTLQWRPLVWMAAGVVAGVACGIKFSGVGVVAMLAAWCLLAPRLSWRARLAAMTTVGVTAVAVYFAQFSVGLALTGKAWGAGAVIDATRGLVQHHAALTEMKHPWTSSWLTWFAPTRPIVMGVFADETGERVLSSLGNLALWWAADAVLLSVLGVVAWRGLRAVLTPGEATSWTPAAFVGANGRHVLLLLAGVAGFIAPWVLSRRDSYLYHYLPAYFFMVALLAAFVGWLARFKPAAALGFVLLVVLVFALYGPTWGLFHISHDAFLQRHFIGSWR